VIVNQDDPLKAQLVDDRITSLLTQANLLLSGQITKVALNYEQILANGGEFQIPFLGQTVQVLGLLNAQKVLDAIATQLPPQQRPGGSPGERLRPPRPAEPGPGQQPAGLGPPAESRWTSR